MGCSFKHTGTPAKVTVEGGREELSGVYGHINDFYCCTVHVAITAVLFQLVHIYPL
jgi:hypothetical protein